MKPNVTKCLKKGEQLNNYFNYLKNNKMETTKKLTIVKDFDCHYCYELFAEDINYLVNELNVFCEIDSNKFTNIVENQKRYNSSKDDYQDSKTIISKGYCQSEYQVSKIYYNKFEIDTKEKKEYLNQLFQLLENKFTHFNNDYYFEITETIILNGITYNSNVLYSGMFSLYNCEFPTKEEIFKEYDSVYSNEFEYDKVIIED